ncbi:hypothetical protein CVIRNUC_006180 [Coccomyxa viridis]|uniref:NYN domain-containing protein n=1 Tax=Coccomyxa viridis TaxID=1274662 RepID=A0AAV1I9L4_9CHLO|nr:hypothetical protein CVIRNUC_006180 [Coccomyxa viridis]
MPNMACMIVHGRAWSSPLPSSKHRFNAAALSSEISSTPGTSREVARIYWDLDNLKPLPGPQGLRALTTLKECMATACSAPDSLSACDVELHAYCNAATLRRLSPTLRAALVSGQGHFLTSTANFRQAVDQAMTASMLEFARLHGSHACIALASGDQGFAKLLRYCRSLGCRTVAVCRGRPYSGKGRSSRWARQPLQAASHYALSWDDVV